MAQSYLFKRGQFYYLRLRIPADVVRHFRKPMIVKALHTRYLADAKRLSRLIVGDVERLFTLIRTRMLTDPQIAELILLYKTKVLDGRARQRDAGAGIVEAAMSRDIIALDPMGGDTLTILSGYREGRTLDDIEQVIKAHQQGIKSRKEEVALGQLRDDTRLATYSLLENSKYGADLPPKEYLNPNEDAYFKAPPTEFQKVARELLRAQIEILGVEIKRLRGDDTDWDARQRTERARPSKMLSEACTLKQREVAAKQRASSTLRRLKDAHDHLLFVLGDKNMRDFTREDMLGFGEVMRQWPSQAYRYYRDSGLTPREVTQRTDWGQPYKDKTLLGKFGPVTGIFEYALKNGWIDRSPCPEWGVAASIPAHEYDPELDADVDRHEPWSRDEIAGLITTVPYFVHKNRYRNPENYWIPLIALFSGARQKEIGSLHCDDIKQCPNGHWYFLRTTQVRKGQSSKTDSSKRRIPVHRMLIELGLLVYREQQMAAGHARLFPQLDKLGEEWEKRYSARTNRMYQRHVAWDDPARHKVFHGFRGSFLRTMRDENGVSIEQASYLTGHMPRLKIPERYAGQMGVEHLNDILQKLDYGIDFVGVLGRWEAEGS